MSILPEESASEGAPEWMVSYADMITILMSFFAVMFSMAMSKEREKNVPMMKSLQRQFGAVPTTFRRSVRTSAGIGATGPANRVARSRSSWIFLAGQNEALRRPGHDRRRDLFRLRTRVV